MFFTTSMTSIFKEYIISFEKKKKTLKDTISLLYHFKIFPNKP